MKTSALFLLFSLLLFSVSCQNMAFNATSGDYYAGANTGEDAAREDVLASQGNNSPFSKIFVIKENINRRLNEMEGPLSESYIKGFKWGYQRAFSSYDDAYNGGG